MSEFVVLGNPGCERVQGFQSALSRAGRPPARLVSWEGFLSGREWLESHLVPGARLRIETPGGHFPAERLLLARGAEEKDARLRAPECQALSEDRGRILHPRQRFQGFRRVLTEIRELLGSFRDVAALNDPGEIAVLADKAAAHERLIGNLVPRPRLIGTPASFDELEARMSASKCRRVFVKLAHGSSASGVVAYQTDGRRRLAITSAEVVRDGGEVRLYNSKRIRRYSADADVRLLLDALCREGVIVESWVPKALLHGGSFDLRVVVIGARARHTVVRRSPTPITNLHLGRDNKREDPVHVRAMIGEPAWLDALAACERAVSVFPGCLYAGVDLLLASRSYRPVVAEVNAFGDLLRRTLHGGQDPYEAELAQALEAVS